MAGDLEFLWIGEKLRGILQDLRQMDNRIRAVENRNAVGTEPELSQAGFAATNFHGIFAYPVQVTSVNTEHCYFLGSVQKPWWSECSPWETDTLITSTLRVDVTTSLCLPEVDEYCLAQHVGPYYTGGDWDAKYGLFDLVRYLKTLDCDEDPSIFPTKEMKFSCCFTVCETPAARAYVDLNVFATGVTSATGCESLATAVATVKFCTLDFQEDWFSLSEPATDTAKVSLQTEATTVISDMQIDAVNFKFQVKYRSLTVLCEHGTSDWVDVHTGTDCATS